MTGAVERMRPWYAVRPVAWLTGAAAGVGIGAALAHLGGRYTSRELLGLSVAMGFVTPVLEEFRQRGLEWAARRRPRR